MSLFRKLAIVSTMWTFFLVAVGGLVRATKSGLGCGTDWPHCHGELIPAFTSSEVVIEYTHRVAAGVIGLMLIGLVLLAFRHYRHHRAILWATTAALGLVIFQGVLGMVVVRRELEAESVVAHLVTAMTLFALLIFIVVATLVDQGRLEVPRDRALTRRGGLAAGSVLALLVVGSYVTGRDAGYVFSDWPLMGGRLVPDLTVELHAIHFAHRLLAVAVGIVVLVVALAAIRKRADFPTQARLAHVALGTFAVQILIGALNVWSRFNAATAVNALTVTLHLALGALIWASLVALALLSSPAAERAASNSAVRSRPALESTT